MNMHEQKPKTGFTVVEILVVVVIVVILASLGVVGYAGLQERTASTAVMSALNNGGDLLEANFARHKDYPPNLAGTEFVTTEGVETVLYTNAPFVRVHSNLTADQNAQLLLNTCRANMPIEIDGQIWNTGCSFAGNNFHIPGRSTSNTILHGPTIQQDDFLLNCSRTGSNCNISTTGATPPQQVFMDANNAIKAQFTEQGGTWPVTVPRGEVPLPSPTTSIANGKATRYCLEARYERFPQVTIMHITDSQSVPQKGECPEDLGLQYLPGATSPGDRSTPDDTAAPPSSPTPSPDPQPISGPSPIATPDDPILDPPRDGGGSGGGVITPIPGDRY